MSLSILSKKKVNTKRSLGSIEFEMSNSLSFGIKYYVITKESKEPLPIKVNALNNQAVKSKTECADEITDAKVDTKDILH